MRIALPLRPVVSSMSRVSTGCEVVTGEGRGTMRGVESATTPMDTTSM